MIETLIVEDKKENLVTIPALMERGFNVDVVRDYSCAVEKLESKRYDMVLTDLMFSLGHGNISKPIKHNYSEQNSEQPLGYPLVLYAVTKGTPKIALYTDMTHHGGAIAATFNQLNVPEDHPEPTIGRASSNKRIFRINESLVTYLDVRDIGPYAINHSTDKITSECEVSEDEFDNLGRGENTEIFYEKKNWLSLAQRINELQFPNEYFFQTQP